MSLLILSTIFSINAGISSTVDECNDGTQIPSPPGEVDYCAMSQNNPESEPAIQASSDEIEPEGSITLYIKPSSLSQPPYNWSVSSEKYTLDKSTTMSNLETVTLIAASGTCRGGGYSSSDIKVTITVTDICGVTGKATIRNTAGSWQDITPTVFYTATCTLATLCLCPELPEEENCGSSVCYNYPPFELIIGDTKWYSNNTCQINKITKWPRGTSWPSACSSSTQMATWTNGAVPICGTQGISLPWSTPKQYMEALGTLPYYNPSTEVLTTSLHRQVWGCP